ncbi:secreted protein [Cricetibacter osteomyelitidis]|uniref:Secreted protein n=1 Tax=Cricetibacter osteomyelitidis TaxID=1521931 RepID=A0A4R2TFN8_9PAST|nr:twin-arginine translocation signal domain-containing protein [Cricetibacter osteomyelitidis]TCP96018.1 secreted protein [Cricetibacter osteomyelitidis]
MNNPSRRSLLKAGGLSALAMGLGIGSVLTKTSPKRTALATGSNDKIPS